MSRSGGWAWRWFALKWFPGTVACVLRFGPADGWRLHVGVHRPNRKP